MADGGGDHAGAVIGKADRVSIVFRANHGGIKVTQRHHAGDTAVNGADPLRRQGHQAVHDIQETAQSLVLTDVHTVGTGADIPFQDVAGLVKEDGIGLGAAGIHGDHVFHGSVTPLAVSFRKRIFSFISL